MRYEATMSPSKYSTSAATARRPDGLVGSERINALVTHADEALQRSDIDEFLRIYDSIGVTPPRRQVLSFGEKALLSGNLYDGLFAFALFGETPDAYYLEMCAKRSDDPCVAARAERIARGHEDQRSERDSGLRGIISAILHR